MSKRKQDNQTEEAVISEHEQLARDIARSLLAGMANTSLEQREAQVIAWAAVNTIDLLKHHWLKDVRQGLIGNDAKLTLNCSHVVDFNTELGALESKITGSLGKWKDTTGLIPLADLDQLELGFMESKEKTVEVPPEIPCEDNAEDNDEEEHGTDEDDGATDLT